MPVSSLLACAATGWWTLLLFHTPRQPNLRFLPGSRSPYLCLVLVDLLISPPPALRLTSWRAVLCFTLLCPALHCSALPPKACEPR